MSRKVINIVTGGGAVSPTDENYIEYIIYPNIPNILYYSLSVKYELDDEINIAPIGIILGNQHLDISKLIAFAILPNARVAGNGMSATLKELFIMQGLDYDNFTRITEEEYYNLSE